MKTKSVDASTSTTDNNNYLKPPKPSHTSHMKTSIIITSANIENDGGIANQAYQKSTHDDDDNDASDESDVSTTIIDGKRAVSISNFEKFTAQQLREGRDLAAFRNRNAAVAAR